MFKRVAPLVVIAAIAGPAAAPSQAEAQTCTFQALGQLNWAIPSLARNANPMDIETGFYDMSGSCEGISGGSFSSAGEYESTVCGSGTWRGTWSGSPASFDYRIEFTDGHGLMYVPETASIPNGHVRFEPVSPGNCVTTDVWEFFLTGAFELAIPDEPPDVLPDDLPEVLPPGTREASAECVPPTLDVIDTPVAGGRLRLRVKQVSPSEIWVCVRVAAGGEGEGGKLILELPAPSGGGIPSTDTSSEACGTTPNNQAPGPHPILGPGTVAGQPVLLDTWSSGTSETWVCAQLGTAKTRVKIPVPGVAGGDVRFERDQ